MARKYISKFRGFPSLTPKVHKTLVHALSVGASIDLACQAAGIVKDTYYRWRRAGEAVHLGEESPDIPYFLPRQPDESDTVWNKRKAAFDKECEKVEKLFLECMQTSARARIKWLERMNQRALSD